MKTAIAVFIGSRRFAWQTGLSLVGMAAAGAAAVMWW
jgi:hypothetical protein